MRSGLFLVNTKQWGVHHPDSLLAPLGGFKSWLDDRTIIKAKDLAGELGISEFKVVHSNINGDLRVLYHHKLDAACTTCKDHKEFGLTACEGCAQ